MKAFTLNQIKEITSSGFIINYFMPDKPTPDRSETLGTHRDDFYMFFLVESGQASMMIDFTEVVLPECSLFYVSPGQVHQRFSTAESARGWFLGVEAPLISDDYLKVFESRFVLQHPVKLSDEQVKQGLALLNLIHERNSSCEESPFNLRVLHSLIQSFLGITAGIFQNQDGPNQIVSRQVQLSHDFKKLLVKHIYTVKSPSRYAGILNVSESYLNEVLKKTTGSTVSYWIQHQMVLEAKRLLYYSQLNIKEIAHQLGYEDSTYFLRAFKKFTNTTPLSFRTENRK